MRAETVSVVGSSPSRVVVITPIYQTELSENERIALTHSFSVLQRHDLFFICPRNLQIGYYLEHFPQARYAYYPEDCFLTTQTYSDLLTTAAFYRSFSNYTHMLIVQSDCIVLRDDLDYWAGSCYDYVGAPWAKVWQFTCPPIGTPFDGRVFYINVGNGGFSLRRISTCIGVIEELDWFKKRFQSAVEDAFFSFAGQLSGKFVIPNAVHAARFSIESEPRVHFNFSGTLPMGTHAWEKWDKEFWLEIFREQGIAGLS